MQKLVFDWIKVYQTPFSNLKIHRYLTWSWKRKELRSLPDWWLTCIPRTSGTCALHKQIYCVAHPVHQLPPPSLKGNGGNHISSYHRFISIQFLKHNIYRKLKFYQLSDNVKKRRGEKLWSSTQMSETLTWSLRLKACLGDKLLL